MHKNTSDGAAEALAGLQRKAAATDVGKGKCPDCGSAVRLWYSPNHRDPGDVDPRATCTGCDWGY